MGDMGKDWALNMNGDEPDGVDAEAPVPAEVEEEYPPFCLEY
jgi:hypothetical protein